MSTGSLTLPENGPPGPSSRLRWVNQLRDASIRSKLALILVVPLTAVLALAAARLVDVGSRARDANQIEKFAELSTDISAVTQSMHRERMAAARYLAAPARSAAENTARDTYNAQVTQTDTLIDAYHKDRRGLDERVQVEPQERLDATGQPSVVETRLDRIDDHLRAMDATRRKVLDREQIAVAEVVLRYGVVITDLLGFGEALGQFAGGSSVADSVRAVAAFSRAKAGAAEQEAVAFAARSAGPLSDEQYAAFIATQTSQQEALLAFSLVATPAQRALVESTVTGDAVTLAGQVSAELSRSVGTASGPTAQDAARAIGAVVDLMRWAELRLEEQLVADARAEDSSVTRQAIIEAILVLLTLVVAVVLAVVLARSLNLALRRLREGALSVANRDLPEAVARLRDVRNLGDGGADDVVRQLRDPIQLSNADEIGQVAQAFNMVHREAVRVAAEQAALRTSVSAMFLNLARRSQSLVDRMIGELDQIERGEEDPKRLAQLFELDHLATRMRRNDENLLVLAGADSSSPRREDALLVDALRAAQSEVELYNRIEFGAVDTDVYVAALAVNDVVRLVAELLDNATRFSSPETVVVADGRRIRDYVVIQIEDRGLGMSEEQMETLNRRLAQPPGVDVAAFRLMGLAVVGRLASRYGIRVELRANIEGGTVAQVILPSSIVVPPRTSDPTGRPHVPSPQHSDTAAPRGWGDAAPTRRTGAATATLPAIAGEPWPSRGGSDATPIRPGVGLPAVKLPVFTELSRPPLPTEPPTPGRPALPSRAQRSAAPGGKPVDAAAPDAPAAPSVPAPSGTTGFIVPVPPVPSSPVPSSPVPSSPVPSSPPADRAAPGAAVAGAIEPVAGPVAGAVPLAGAGSATGAGPVTVVFPAVQAPTPPVRPHPGWGAALAAMPPAPPPPAPRLTEDRAEAPIFREMQASWFHGPDEPQTQEWSMPTAGYAPPSRSAVTTTPSVSSTPAGPTMSGSGTATSSVTGPAAAPVAPASSAGPAPTELTATESTPAELTATESTPAELTPAELTAAGLTPAGLTAAESAGTRRAAEPADAGGTPPADRGDAARSVGGENGVASTGREAGETTGGQQSTPRPRPSAEDAWRTAADEGWHRAMAAADPPDAGRTRSGLPKRVPQAQLVPGGVHSGPRDAARRTPDEVRGLLSAYHRGVQRGRTAGSSDTVPTAPAPKENEQ